MSNSDQKSKDEFIEGYATVDDFSKESLKTIIEATKSFAGLPQPGVSWELQKSYPEFSRAMKNCRSRIVPMISTLLQHSKISTSDFKARDVEEKFDFIVDANDDILERIGSALDEASGEVKKTEAIVINPSAVPRKPPGTWGKRKAQSEMQDIIEIPSKSATLPMGSRPIKKAFHRNRVSEKPQLKFSSPIDNSLSPFVPKLLYKPNSIKPLSILPEYTEKNELFYGHPYQVELDRWEPKDDVLQKVVPKLPKKLLATPFNKVFEVKDVEKMIKHLRTVTEMAVDVEHHSYRSFLGLTCLLQVSTREQDFVIDTLALRDNLQDLNEIFTNPKIVKVLHGASSDIDWLQRDLGLYIVNMFDTGVAAKQLGLPQQSLQFLLNRYCNLKVDKSMQLADWRIRPIPDDMLNYARQDTHNLLYIYDIMKNELIEAGNQHKNLLISVFDQSKIICAKRYEKPGNNPQLSLRKTRRTLNNRQLYAYTEIYKWRDAIAREKDESLGYILPNHMLFQICETLPKEMTGILACCDPVPVLVHSNLGLLHRIILKARELPLREETSFQDKSEKKEKPKDWVILMNSLHDVNLCELERGGVVTDDTLENNEIKQNSSSSFQNPSSVRLWPLEPKPIELTGVQLRLGPSLDYIRKIIGGGNRNRQSKIKSVQQEQTASPFERYQLSRKIMDMLKEPEARATADLTNPLVKAVYDTLVYDPDEEPYQKKELQPDNVTLAKILPDSEFVPFNPFASKPNAKKKRKVQNEPWQESFANGVDEDDVIEVPGDFDETKDIAIVVDPEDGECSDDSDVEVLDPELPSSSQQSAFISVPNQSAQHSKKKKKKKNNIINKLNFMSKKRNKQQNNQQRPQELSNEGAGEVTVRSEQNFNANKRKFQQDHDAQSNSSFSQKNKKSKNWGNKNQSPNDRGRPNQQSPQKNFQGGKKNKNAGDKKKTSFFNRFKKDGKSVTFK